MVGYSMSLSTTIFALIMLLVIFSLISLVLFGQLTVRKLRKNPATKDELGIEFISGWDIINVAEALASPNGLFQKLKRSPLSALYANSELLHRHTNRFDRILAKVFYYSLISSGTLLILYCIIDFAISV
jgi:hypothetical protein